MKGLILAGGKGTRLYPLTAVTNKHLTPIGNIPMIEYPLNTIKSLQTDSISIVTGGEHFKDIVDYLGLIHKDIKFSFHYQPEAGGIAQAIAITEPFLKNESIAVILGDNIFEEDFKKAKEEFEARERFSKKGAGAMLFLKAVEDPQRFGVAEIENNQITNIVEKPKNPKSNYVVTGLYFYDNTVFDKIRNIKASARGELEITDINNAYLKEDNLYYHIINGFWSDAGTFPSRRKCEDFVDKNLEKDIIKSLPSNVKDILTKNLLDE